MPELWRYAKEMVAVDPWGVALGALIGVALFFAAVVPFVNAVIR